MPLFSGMLSVVLTGQFVILPIRLMPKIWSARTIPFCVGLISSGMDENHSYMSSELPFLSSSDALFYISIASFPEKKKRFSINYRLLELNTGFNIIFFE